MQWRLTMLDALNNPLRKTAMNGTEITKLRRREFLASSSSLLAGAVFLKASHLPSQAAPTGSDLSEELSPAELEMVNKSIMARDMDNFWHKGYS
jgi:hypothetical protein